MPDQDALALFLQIFAHFHMHLGDQRADRVKDPQITRRGLLAHGLGDPMGAENDRGIIGHFVQLLDKDRALVAQRIHHILVMHHLMADIDRRAEQVQGAFHDADGPIDAGAKTARVGK